MAENSLTTYQLLRNKFPENEYVLIAEVSDASGFSRSRSLDYMAINLWQSRGLAIIGIEVKSNRNDWLKELKNPAKQENHYKYCDYFYLLTTKEGVANMEEIPASWGWYHANSKSIRTMKQAPDLNPLPIGRSLMCAMLRRAAAKDGFVHKDNLEAHIQEAAERIASQKELRKSTALTELEELQKTIEEFKAASGIDITDRWSYGGDLSQIGSVLKIILNEQRWDRYTDRLKKIISLAKEIQASAGKDVDELVKLSKTLHLK